MEQKIKKYLNQHIPLSKALGIRVEHVSADKVVLWAPLSKNINHKETVFGGSLHAIATLCCWAFIFTNLNDRSFQIIITKSEIDYKAPIDADFKVECLKPESEAWQRFLKILYLKGKARLVLSIKIYHNNHLCVEYKGEFAAIKST